MHLSVITFVVTLLFFFPGSYFSQILLPLKFLVTERGMHFTDAEAAACPYKFYACFLIKLDIAF